MAYILFASSRENEYRERYETLEEIIRVRGIDRYPDFIEEYNKCKTDEERIELIEMELNEAMMPFSFADDSITRWRIQYE